MDVPLCNENCISWIFGLFFENAHKWKRTTEIQRKQGRILFSICIVALINESALVFFIITPLRYCRTNKFSCYFYKLGSSQWLSYFLTFIRKLIINFRYLIHFDWQYSLWKLTTHVFLNALQTSKEDKMSFHQYS